MGRENHEQRRQALGLSTSSCFQLNNIIGLPMLDIDVYPAEVLTWFPRFDILVFDPGEMVGWAGVATNSLDRGYRFIEVGQGPWHECLRFEASRIFIETTPFASQRTFDTWPIRYEGAVRAKIYPKQPGSVRPTDLKVAKKWFRLPRGHGLGRHAKDALTHLIWVLVRESQS